MSDRAAEERQDQPTMAGGLRTAREGLGMSQRELATRVNVSPSMISQIEAGQSQPSVNTLYAIVTELDISMDELFGHRPGSQPDDLPVAVTDLPFDTERGDGGGTQIGGSGAGGADPAGPDSMGSGRLDVQGAVRRAPVVIRGTDRSRLRLETGVTWERLASPDSEALDFMEVVYDAGGTSSRDGTLMRHNSVEVALLLSGSLALQVGFDVHHLEPGDSIAFDSTVPHRLWNPGEIPARAVWLVLAH